MISNIPKISVLVICYKQEDVIRRAIDSLIQQRDYIYEICINDDKSPDRTWDIILDYQKRFPELIKPVQNNSNLGIFQNIEATWMRPTGDLIYQLSGDDECPDDYFKHIVNFVNENNVDYINEAICIYGDYEQINVDGSHIKYTNNMVNKAHPLKLKIRQLLCNRSACFSKIVLERHRDVSEGRSYIVELTQDAELQMYSDYNYYIPVLGNIYYAGIGVSKHFTKEEKIEHLRVYDHFLKFCNENSINIDNCDRNYIEYMKCYRRGQIPRALIYYIKSIDISLGWKGLLLERMWFVFRNRILKKER